MASKGVRRLVNVAVGIGAIGVFGINIATRSIQSRRKSVTAASL